MADSEAEIITLSSDDESKPKISMRSSRNKNVNVAATVKSMQNMKPSKHLQSTNTSSQNKNASGCVQAVASESGLKVISVPENRNERGILTHKPVNNGSHPSAKSVVTSPKLSLKRRRTEDVSPERVRGKEEQLEGLKKLKLDEPELSSDILKFKSQAKALQKILSEAHEADRNKRKFLELLDYSKPFMEEMSDEDKSRVVKKLMLLFHSVERSYVSSESFALLLDSSRTQIEADSSCALFVLVNIRQELKKYKCKKESKEHSSNDVVLNGNKESLASNVSSESPILSTSRASECLVMAEEKMSDSQSVDSNFSFLSNSKTVKPPVVSDDVVVDKVFPKTFTSVPSTSGTSKKTLFDNKCAEGVNDLRSDNVPPSVKTSFAETSPVGKESEFHSTISSRDTLEPEVESNGTVKQSFPKSKSSSLQSKPGTSEDRNASILEGVDERNLARIKKLEKTLHKLDKAIKKCQSKELSMDDLDNSESFYMKEEQYKKRFMVVWKKLCQLTKSSPRTGRIVEKRFRYEGSRYRGINQGIEKFINKRKTHEKFPDFSEVLNVIKNVNEIENMGLTERDISHEAESVFKDVGIELKERRCRDDQELFGCYLTDNLDPLEDPAEQDENLKNVLDENGKIFETKISELVDSYAVQQQKKEESKEKDTDDDNDDDNDEEEEQEEDDNENDDVEEDLPETAPASPELNVAEGKSRKEEEDDIIEIREGSDKSTDPNEDIDERCLQINDDLRQITKHIETESVQGAIVLDIGSSDGSSSDLPSVEEILGR